MNSTLCSDENEVHIAHMWHSLISFIKLVARVMIASRLDAKFKH